MNLEKLKDQARKFEQKEDWRRAIEVYLKAIDEFESGREPTPDLSLYNRIGDLYMKAGDNAAAVKSYERAVDLYADQGFYNNAIALCGKILRAQPGRMPVHLRLAYLHAHKNVLFEAKRYLIEYLERMNRAGEREDGIAAMAAFADQFAGNPDIRLMLIELLLAADRRIEALRQLRKVLPELEERGDVAGLAQARARLRELDPHAEESAPAAPQDAEPAGEPVVFLDTATGLAEPDDPLASLDGLTLERTGEGPELDAASFEPVSDFDSASVEAPADDVAPLEGLVVDGAGTLDLDAEAAALPADMELETAHEPLDFDVVATPMDGLDRGTAALGIEDIERIDGIETPSEFERSEEADFAPVVDAELQPLEPSDELLDLPPIPVEPRMLEPSDEPLLGAPAEPLDFELVGGHGGMESAESDLVEADAPVELPFIDLGGETDGAIAELEDRVLEDPGNPEAHAALGHALVGIGQVARGVEELELAVMRFDERGDVPGALAVTETILALSSDDVRYHQKAVELAFRLGERPRLLAAYQGLGEALARAGESDKAAAVFRRVLEHDPTNAAATAELRRVTGAAAPRAGAAPAAPRAPAAPAAPARQEPPPPAAATPTRGDDFVDLGSLVLEAEGPRDTRMRMGGEEPPTSGDEQRDFDEMLDAFKRGIEENLGEDDHQAHYDLGVAFKEMGLLDEAIGEFQKALRGADGRLRTAEALGQCFFDKGQFGIAETVLRRGLAEPGGDDAKIGLIYWLGRALESQGKRAEASASYERALAVDIRFMDLGERIQRLTAERGA